MLNIIKKLLLLLLTLIIILMILEITVRVINKEGTFFEYDDLLGSKHITNANGWYTSEEFRNYIRINSDGWYDIEYNITKASEVKRMVIIGDSLAEALQVNINDSFQQIIEYNLSKNNKKVEVINMGVSGYGTAQEYLILEKEGLKYKPNIVMMIFTQTDIRNNYYELQKSNFKPYFDINSKGDLYLSRKPLEKSSIIIKIYNKLLKYSKLLKFIQLQIIKKLDSDNITKKITNVDNIEKINNIPLDIFLYNKTYEESFKKAWTITEELIKKTKKLSEDNNAEFILVINIADIERIKEDNKKYNLDLDYNKLNNMLIKICEKNKIRCINLKQPIEDFIKNNTETKLFFKINGHLTKAGHKLIAEEIEKNLGVI